MQKSDIAAVVVAITLHAGIAYGLLHVRERPPHRPTWLEVEVRKPAPPQPKLTPPAPPKPPPERKVVERIKKIAPPPVAPPPPNVTPPPTPPKEPPKPVFGVNMDSVTDGESNVAVPVGNTTMIDPKKSGKGPVVPLPAAPAAPPKPSYAPVSELYIKTMPEIDSDACGRSVQYPAEAEQMGIEGDVSLRIEYDENGHVHSIKVLKGLGHGLDQVAINAMTHHAQCKASAAIATDGKKVPVAITYKFTFEIPR